jgi:hypothetical protein
LKLFKLLLPAALLCGAANASLIVYTEQDTVSGSLGGVGFTNATMTLVLTGDTSNVTNPSSGLFQNAGPATVAISGLGSGTFLDSIIVFAFQPNQAAGFEDITKPADILDTLLAPPLGSYDLTTSIGPVLGTAAFNPSTGFATSAGTLVLTAASNPTFSAAVAAPETSSLGLVGIGLAGVVVIARRKAAKA